MDSSATESEDYSDEEKSEYLEGMSEEQRVFHRFVCLICCFDGGVEITPLLEDHSGPNGCSAKAV